MIYSLAIASYMLDKTKHEMRDAANAVGGYYESCLTQSLEALPDMKVNPALAKITSIFC